MGDLTRLDGYAELVKADERIRAARVAMGIGTRRDHARKAIRRNGIRVRCVDCDHEERVVTWSGRRLRTLGCAECGGRLRPARWPGFAQP